MATKTWFGGTGNYNDPNNWSPPGVPLGGETAVISAGTVHLHNQIVSNVGFEFDSTFQASQPVLDLRNVILDKSNVSFSFTPFEHFGTINISGVVLSSGNISLFGREFLDDLTINQNGNSIFLNSGTISEGRIRALT